jgi:predicted nucleic acid-binding protein
VSYLLDTNVLSEGMKPRPNAGVVRWLNEADEDDVFISVVTYAEIHYGALSLPRGARRRGLETWLVDDLMVRFEGRAILVNTAVAYEWGVVSAQCRSAGRPISSMDAFIAATARLYDLTLVTRDVRDFEISVKDVLNPWDE